MFTVAMTEESESIQLVNGFKVVQPLPNDGHGNQTPQTDNLGIFVISRDDLDFSLNFLIFISFDLDEMKIGKLM